MKITLALLFLFSSGIAANGQERPALRARHVVDVAFKLRGYFYAATAIADSAELKEYWGSRNFPRPVTADMDLPEGKISLTVLPDARVTFAGEYRGIKV